MVERGRELTPLTWGPMKAIGHQAGSPRRGHRGPASRSVDMAGAGKDLQALALTRTAGGNDNDFASVTGEGGGVSPCCRAGAQPGCGRGGPAGRK